MRLMLFLKISLMAFALGGVFYSMRYLRSQEFVEQTKSENSALAILLGTTDSPPWNWCPAEMTSLTLRSKNPMLSSTKSLDTVADRVALCEVLTEPVLKADLDESFATVLQALPKTGEPIYLERNAKGVFRVLGRTFRSQGLEKALKRYDF